ncbi:MAG: shikimate kinase AroK [Pseudomonadota bacterium]
MQTAGRIFLIGPMGTGKTTVGAQLAAALGLEFIDCDQELERRTGASVSLIFDVEGESGFRERERKLIAELTQRDDIILATGGGAVLNAENRLCLSSSGFVVYLRSDLQTLLARVRYDTSRPLLQTDNREETLRKLIAQRAPLYEMTADLIVDTNNVSTKAIVNLIQAKLADD